MPLLDHFHAPLFPHRVWQSFYLGWACAITRTLNRRLLPPGNFAQTQTHVGGRLEVDEGSLEEEKTADGSYGSANDVIPAVFPDEFEVQVFRTTGGGVYLIAAIEFVSPDNKDRLQTRRAFSAKCGSYLQAGVGLLVIDIVTSFHANLHDDLMDIMQQPATMGAGLYATAYRPTRQPNGDQIELWLNPLALDQALPTMPLALRGGPTLPIDLEASYLEVCADSRIP